MLLTSSASSGLFVIEPTKFRLQQLDRQRSLYQNLCVSVRPALQRPPPVHPARLVRRMSNANPIRKARNDALALSEFRQYVGTYPDSELADNAEYWIGEI